MTKKTKSKAQKRANAEVLVPSSQTAQRREKEADEFAVRWETIGQMEKDIDPQQVDELADHVFHSVLSKFGWTRNEQGHLEKSGAEEAA